MFIGANGDALGPCLIRSGGHQWADLDAYADQDPDPDGSLFNAQVGQYTTSVVNRISQTNVVPRHGARLKKASRQTAMTHRALMVTDSSVAPLGFRLS